MQHLPFGTGVQTGLNIGANASARYERQKRVIDIILAVFLLIFTTPLVLIAALAIKLISSGPAFITVPRIGLGGKQIRIFKIRTMHVNADRLLQEYLARHPSIAEEWQKSFKLKHDPRIIPLLGTFFRKTSIDELPQLVDVVFGRMSMVGPRPFPDYHLEAFDPSFRELRCSVVPGLTGLWQIECRNVGDLDDQVYWDEMYIRQRSMSLDLKIFLRTAFVVMIWRSAY